RIDASVFRQDQYFNGFQSATYSAGIGTETHNQQFLFDVAEPNKNEFTLYSLTVAANLGPVELISSTSEHTNRYIGTEETGQALLEFLGQTAPSSITEENKLHGWSQELRLKSAQGSPYPVDWVIGGFAGSNTQTQRTRWGVPALAEAFGSNLFSLDATGPAAQ